MPLGTSLLGGLGAAGGSGNLGTLFINLTANSTGMVAGMKQAEVAVATGSRRILATATKMAAGVTGALAAIGAAGVVQFGQFQKEMAKSTAIMGDLSDDLRKQMEATARQMATQSTTSVEKLAEAYFFLASAGLSAEQSIAALSTVNAFAIAGQFDMARATDLLTDAQSALGLTVKDSVENMRNMQRVSDVLVKANNLANASVEQFSSSLTREAGAALKSFGIDVEEGVAVLAAFADQGVKAELAGTGLSRILRLMTSAAVSNAQAYREMGVRVFDASGEIRNMADIIADLEGALGGLSDEQKVVALETLGFQARVQGVILPLLGTSDAIRRYEKELRRAGGTTQDVAEKQMRNFFDQLTITWNRIKDILLTIGEELTPVLMVLNESLQNVVGSHDDLNQSMSYFKSNIAPALISTIGVVGDAFYGWRIIIKGLQVGFAGFGLATGKVFDFVLDKVIKVVSFALQMLDRLQQAVMKIPGAADLFGGGIRTAPITNFMREAAATVDEGNRVLEQLVAENQRELAELVDQGRFSERLVQKWQEAGQGVKKEGDKIVETTKDTVQQINNELSKVSAAEATNTINRMYSEAFGTAGQPGSFRGIPVADPATAEIQNLQAEQKVAQEQLSILEDLKEQEIALTDETLKKKLELHNAYTEQLRALQLAQAQLILNSASNMFGDLANIAEGFGARQSGIYKALFAASKAFAIAEATVKIAQGIAAAASLQFPANIPAIASVVAATAGIISNIQSVQLEFGGGKAVGGPVTPGTAYMVGEAGPELFTPGSAGNIIPNEALGNKVNVVVNNYTDAKAEVRESENGDEKTIEIVIARTKNSIASDIQQGTGAVTKSLQSSFGLKRAGK